MSRAAALALLLLAAPGAAAEMLLKLPTICTTGGCAEGGLHFEREGELGGVVSGRIEHRVLQSFWEVGVNVYCAPSGTEEVVYRLVPDAPPRQRVWVKFAGEIDLVGWIGVDGRAVELAYGSEGLAEAFDALRSDGRALDWSQSPETLLWIARALHARACG